MFLDLFHSENSYYCLVLVFVVACIPRQKLFAFYIL